MESRLPLREESRVGTARASHPVDKGRLEIQRGFRGMKRLVRLLLSSLLAGTWLASLVLPAGASWSALTPQASLWDTGEELVVPSLPNNENYLGTGPWHGVLALANASAFPVTVDVKKADGTLLTSLSLPGNGLTAIAAGTLFGSGAGSGLVLSAREQGGCAPQAVQEFTVTRGGTPNSADTIALPIPAGINVTDVVVSQATTPYSWPTDYTWTQVGTTLNISWAPSPAPEPTGGSAYTVQVAYNFPCRPARISAAVKLVAPAPSSNGRTASTHQMVTGHTALAKGQAVGSTIVVPIVQANYSGWKTILHITNFGSSPCAVTANFYQNPSGSLTHTANQTVAAGATWQLDVQTVLPSGWLGSARITGTGCALAASLDRIKPQQPWGTTVNMALTNLGLPIGQLTNTVYVPLVFQAYFNWNTGLAVTNAGPNPATVTINYYGTNGGLLATSSLGPILPGAMGFDYLTGSGGQLAQAVITSTQPITVSVDAVKYTGGGPDVGQALSSMGINGPLGTIPVMPALRIPLFQKAGVSGNDTSGIQIWNGGGAAATVNVDFFDSSGAPVPPSTFTLPGIAPNGAVTVYAPTVGPLSANYQGEVRITVTAGGPVVAVTNNVNYDVQYDGSAAFNVATSQRSLRVDFGRTSNKNGVPTLLVAQTVDENGVQMQAQQILITDGGAGLTITMSPANTTQYGIARVQLVGTNTVANVTVCWDLNIDGVCQATEPQVTQSMSWSP